MGGVEDCLIEEIYIVDRKCQWAAVAPCIGRHWITGFVSLESGSSTRSEISETPIPKKNTFVPFFGLPALIAAVYFFGGPFSTQP
jgi:hypothetical protein